MDANQVNEGPATVEAAASTPYIRNVIQNLADYVFGYDFFISYRQEDGLNLPRKLAERLSEAGFRVFLDEGGIVAGDELTKTTERRARISSYLLMIARPGAVLRSDWVVHEVSVALRAGKQVLVVDVDNAFSASQGTTPDERQRVERLRTLLKDRLRMRVTGSGSDVFDGDPPDALIDDIKRSFSAIRQDRRRSRIFLAAAVVFAALAVVAVLKALDASAQQKVAVREAGIARDQSAKAAYEARISLSRQLAAQASSETFRPDLRLLLAIAAYDTQSTVEARRALWNALWINGVPFHYLWSHSPTELQSSANGADVDGLTFSDDDREIRTLSSNGSLVRWDTGNHRLLDAPTVPISGKVLSSAFDRTGAEVAVAVSDKGGVKAFVWDLARQTSHPIALPSALGSLRGLSYSDDDQFLAATSPPDNEVLIWNARTLDRRAIKPCAQTSVDVAFSHDSRWVFANCADGVSRWSIGSPSASRVIVSSANSDSGRRTSPVVSYDNQSIAVGNRASIEIWKASTKSARILSGNLDEVRALAMSPDGPHVTSAGYDGVVRTWNYLSVADAPRAFLGHNTAVYGVSYSKQGHYLASFGDDGTVIQWDLDATLPVKTVLAGDWASAQYTAAASRVPSIAYVDGNGYLRVASDTDHEPRILQKVGDVEGLALSGDGSALAYISSDGDIRLCALGSSSICRFESIGHASEAERIVLSPSGDYLAYSAGSSITLISRKHRATTKTLGGDILALTFSADGKLLASSSDDGKISLMTIPELGSVPGFKIREGIVRSLAFSPTDPLLASGDSNNEIIIWNLTTNNSSGVPLTGHGRPVFALAFSQDGRTLASSGGNKSLIFWDVASREPLSNPLKANADIAGLAFSAPDGNQLISWDDDGQIIRWDLNVDHWKGLACHMANRPITKLEWVQYVGDATSYKPICTI